MQTIPFHACTKELLKEHFHLKQLWSSPLLDVWFQQAQAIELEAFDVQLLNLLQEIFIQRGDDWNEFELNAYFISPIVTLVNFNTDYFCAFAERSIEAEMGDYKLTGKPDLMVAKGESFPKIPYFCFSEYKKQIAPEGNPVYQALGEMLAAQQLNSRPHPIYGLAVTGRLWQFLVLDQHTYCISKSFAVDDEEILAVVKILKALKMILLDIAKLDA